MTDYELEAARIEAAQIAALIENLEVMGAVTLELVPGVGFESKPGVRIRESDAPQLQGSDTAWVD